MPPELRSVELEVRPEEVPVDAVIVDIREPYEWEAGRIPGSIHVPMDEVAEWIVAAPPARLLVFVCLGGLRAAMVTRACVSIGLEARYLRAGLRGWVAAGHELEPAAGHLADHGRPPNRQGQTPKAWSSPSLGEASRPPPSEGGP